MKTIAKKGKENGAWGRSRVSWKSALFAVLIVPAGSELAAQTEGSGAASVSAGKSPWFVEASVGLSFIPGGDILIDGVSYEAEYDNGQLFRGAVGRRLGRNWTTALEWYYRTNDAESFVSDSAVIGGGDLASTNLFLGLTYTVDERFNLLGFRPSLGFGVGLMQEVNLDLEGFGNEDFSDNWTFGWQWSVAVGRPIGRAGWLYVEGRAISGGEVDLESSTQDRAVTFDYDAWALLAGFRWSF
ncbi:hypothetical protein ASA1KI_05870 [Opitutales bacterium ASA1]|uniref:hypothetical protein n=1 Tax=Congregicoccus parvus TaxID=3081749 RepID=UPI002B2E47AF|nr:hypothetical protein ASA1KI_05870 [Opitutales bacterium ASA1]